MMGKMSPQQGDILSIEKTGLLEQRFRMLYKTGVTMRHTGLTSGFCTKHFCCKEIY
jgi:hypothetical protein